MSPSQPTWIVQPYGFIAQGANTTFTWSMSTASVVNDTVTYSVNYSTNGGSNWTNIVSGLNDTQYTWVLPSNISTGTILFLQVVAVESNGQSSTSPNSGAITVVSLQQPAPVATSVVPSTIMTYANDPMIAWRAGTADDPFVQKDESLPVINGRVILSEVPDTQNRVVVDGYFEVNDSYHALSSTEFFVDYSTGLILFNIGENGKTVSFSYKGRGKILIPANRVYLNSDNPSYYNNFPQSIQDIVDNHQTAIQVESNIVYYVKQLSNIGDVADLTTTDKSTIVNAINSVQSIATTNTSSIGTLSNLYTIAKDSLVNALNEVKTETDSNKTDIGTLSDLTTATKVDLVSSINEVKSESESNKSNIGTLSSLSTASNSDLVSAINEVKAEANTNQSNIGTLSSLSTAIKSDLVSAINNIKSQADTNSGDITTNTNNINTINTEIGTLSNLTTTTKTDLTSALNEVRTELHKVTDGNGTIVNATITVGNVSYLPTASAFNRNQIAVVQGDGATTADVLYINLLSASGTYSWVQIISG